MGATPLLSPPQASDGLQCSPAPSWIYGGRDEGRGRVGEDEEEKWEGREGEGRRKCI